MVRGATATDAELAELAINAVKASRVLLVNGQAYLDGSRVYAPRIARALEGAYWDAVHG